MGPDKHPHLFKLFGDPAIPQITWEEERRDKAETVLRDLSAELNEYPVKSPVSEATLPAKLYTLGKLSYDPIGVAGFNPMEMIGLHKSGASIDAFAGPSHDRFEDTQSRFPIHTRAILIIPPDHFSSEQAELEFFGLNQYAQREQPVESPIEEALNYNVQHPDEAKKLIITKGEPIRGVTNVFAVRHKAFGTVRIYGLRIQVTPLPSMQGIDRTSEEEITYATHNNVGVTVKELTGEEFDEAVKEFELALNAIKMAQVVDPEHTTMSLEERAALQSLGTSALLMDLANFD